MFRVPVPDYSDIGFREAVNNAILHRDYSRREDIYIQWYPDHILVTSPGAFLPDITTENIFVHEQEKSDGQPLNLDELLVLNHLFFDRRADSESVGRLIPKGTTQGHAVLEGLVERGLVEAKGEKKGRVYHLHATIYAQFGNYKNSWEILENYPRATLAILDSAGHNLQLEQVEVFDCLVEEWILIA